MTWKHILICATFWTISACDHSEKGISASERLDTFYETDMPESNLIPYLVAGGPEMLPLLVKAVQNTELKKRRYLIGALGEFIDDRAVSVLSQIALSPEEVDYIKCDALQSLKKIMNKQSFDEMIELWGANSKICDQY